MNGNFISRIFFFFLLIKKKKKITEKSLIGAEHNCLRIPLNFRDKEKMH